MRNAMWSVAAVCCLGASLVANAQTPAKDKDFVKTAGEGSYAEIRLGELAAQKGMSPDVKAFGTKMTKDHAMLIDQMKSFADKMGLKPPTMLTAGFKVEEEKLKLLSGEKFDKEYVEYMMKDHHEDLKEFITERSNTQDAALKSAVAKGETVIKEHTMMIDGLGKKMGLTPPPMQSGM